jgi:hypothetical protein
MDKTLPRHLAWRGRRRHAESLARNPSGARDRRAAADRRQCGYAPPWRAGANPHRAERDQAGLPVPATARSCGADQRGRCQHRRADRHPIHRIKPSSRHAVRRQNLPAGRQWLVRGHRQGGERCRVGRPAVDFASGSRQETGSFLDRRRSAPTRRSMCGDGRCSTATIRFCVLPMSCSTCSRRPR